MNVESKLHRFRKRAVNLFLEQADRDVPMLLDYEIDSFLRNLFDLPSRPKGSEPYIGWMLHDNQKTTVFKTSSVGLDLIKSWEGFRADAYRCPAGVWTIGYGHTLDVNPGSTLSLKQGELLLLKDLRRYEQAVNNYVTVPLYQNQFDALVSFCFNVGTSAFKNSTLLRLLNQKQYTAAAKQLLRWTTGGGRVLPGLVKRRKAEFDLFMS